MRSKSEKGPDVLLKADHTDKDMTPSLMTLPSSLILLDRSLVVKQSPSVALSASEHQRKGNCNLSALSISGQCINKTVVSKAIDGTA